MVDELAGREQVSQGEDTGRRREPDTCSSALHQLPPAGVSRDLRLLHDRTNFQGDPPGSTLHKHAMQTTTGPGDKLSSLDELVIVVA